MQISGLIILGAIAISSTISGQNYLLNEVYAQEDMDEGVEVEDMEAEGDDADEVTVDDIINGDDEDEVLSPGEGKENGFVKIIDFVTGGDATDGDELDDDTELLDDEDDDEGFDIEDLDIENDDVITIVAGDTIWDLMIESGMSPVEAASAIATARTLGSSSLMDLGISSGNIDLIYPGERINLGALS